MIINAKRSRTKRKDPVQEKIVSQKDLLNERTSKLIEFLKEVKRGWNGGPAPLVGVDVKINLTQPIPSQVITSAEAIASEFSNIVSELKNITSLQNSYAEERIKKINEKIQQNQSVAYINNSNIEKFASLFVNNIEK